MSTDAADPAKISAAAQAPWRFTIVLRREPDGPELTKVEASDADLVDALTEVWMDGCLRRGLPDVPFAGMSISLQAIFQRGSGAHSTGFVLEATNPRGETIRREFSIDAFRDGAVLAAQQLVLGGTLKADALFYYDVIARRRPPVSPQPTGPEFTVETTSPSLAYLKKALKPLLKKARTLGEMEERAFYVFYTEEAFSRAQAFAHKGGGRNPPVETGAALIGWLCSCPDSGEFFVVVSDALEAVDADRGRFSLSYTSRTWARMQAVVRARQKRPGMRAVRILGQAHGHNFLPAGGAAPCAECPKVEVCDRTSVFVSSDDRIWSRAVFARQPWQLCHVFGLNARHERVHSLFSLRGNRLLERGFHVISGFDPGSPT